MDRRSLEFALFAKEHSTGCGESARDKTADPNCIFYRTQWREATTPARKIFAGKTALAAGAVMR
jgi:hypothetical protein